MCKISNTIALAKPLTITSSIDLLWAISFTTIMALTIAQPRIYILIQPPILQSLEFLNKQFYGWLILVGIPELNIVKGRVKRPLRGYQ